MPHDCGIRTKLHTIAQYKFTLAFENSITEDYVTEKFFEPLAAGSVPVYRGAPNVDEFAPADHCYINAADFSGPAELATYLDHLHHDKDEYQGYLAWKRQPLRDSFLSLVADTVPHPLCRLAHHIAVARAGTDVSPGSRGGLVASGEVGTDGRAFSA